MYYILYFSTVIYKLIYFSFRVPVKEYNLRTEPKFVVFLTQLLSLFHFCHQCKRDKIIVNVYSHGTMAEVIMTCIHPNCGKKTTWHSQPNFPGTKIAAGNLLLSFGILLAGSSATKVLRVFQHMGMACFSLVTFFRYQRVSLIGVGHIALLPSLSNYSLFFYRVFQSYSLSLFIKTSYKKTTII